MRYLITPVLLLLLLPTQAQTLVDKIKKLRPDTHWQQVAAIPLQFPAYHPQGMVRIGDYFYLSSVEVKTARKNGDGGEGTGHLFKLDSTGKLIAKTTLGEGTMYHPGGIDYDGSSIWVPVAEYRPNSQSIIYKVDPSTLQHTEVSRFEDHLGGLVRNTTRNTLSAVSWGARSFYQWSLTGKGSLKNTHLTAQKLRITNPSFYIDYQDCHYVGNDMMICSGLQRYSNNGQTVCIGGFDLISLRDYRPVHQVPIRLWSPTGTPMTNNPFWIESSSKGIKAYFIPDDDANATLFIYEAELHP